MSAADRIPETRLTIAAALALVEDLARHGTFSTSARDEEDERDALNWLLADRQRWINVAAGMGNHEARALATKGFEP